MTSSVTSAGSLSLAQMAQAALDDRQLAGAAAAQPQDPPLAVRALDLQAMQAALMKQLSMAGELSTKLNRVTDALASSVSEIVAKRPDLADAQFDFQTDDGAIQVVSKTMKESDRAWIEQTLNGNASLVLATRAFHDQAVDIDAQGALVRGETPFSADDRAAASQRADGRFRFMDLINAAVERNHELLQAGGHYVAQDGTPLKVEQSAGTARGTLALLDIDRQLSSGTAVFVDGSGQRTYGMRPVLIDMDFAVLAAPGAQDGNRLGFHAIA
ncbi:hypothetical protein ACRS8P_07595 [Burkholderia cenocepacia]